MERWGDKRESLHRNDHRMGTMIPVDTQRSSTGALETNHYNTTSESPCRRQKHHYDIPLRSSYQYETDMLNLQQQSMKRHECDDRRRDRWNRDDRQRPYRSSSMNGGTSHDSSGNRHCGTSTLHPFRVESSREFMDQSHRSSLSVASDPLPSQAHHNTKLGSRWNPKVHKTDVAYQEKTTLVPSEIIATASNSRYDDSINDLSDGSPGIDYSSSVDNHCNETTITSSLCIPRSKPHDANPQEDSSSLSNVENVGSFELRNTSTVKTKFMLGEHLELSPGSKVLSSTSLSNVPKKRYLSQDETEEIQLPPLCDEQTNGTLDITGDYTRPQSNSSDRNATCDLLNLSVGCRVAIFWEGEGKYFSGTVKKFVPIRKKPYYVKYDDGDKEWINFKRERFNVIERVNITEDSNDNSHYIAKVKSTSGQNHIGNVEIDWVSSGIVKNDSDSDTDDDEVSQWAVKMLGVSPPVAQAKQLPAVSESTLHQSIMPVNSHWHCISDTYDIPMSISEKVKLGRRNRSTSLTCPVASPPRKQTKPAPKIDIPTMNAAADTGENEADAKLRKQQARPLTTAEINSILGEDCTDTMSTSWVRRSVRQPCKSSLHAPRVKELLEKLVSNDTDMIVLKMKKYCSDLDTPSIVIDAVLDALEDNSNCEALYIQNFNEGLRDDQVLRLLRVLQRPSCKIWCLNIGETYKVQMKTWEKFTNGLASTNVTHMYASEHTITSELKDQIRETIRQNRSKHHYHDDPSNLDTIVRCTHCWWNPINAKSLRQYVQRKGYEHILRDAEVQGLQGTMTGALLS